MGVCTETLLLLFASGLIQTSTALSFCTTGTCESVVIGLACGLGGTCVILAVLLTLTAVCACHYKRKSVTYVTDELKLTQNRSSGIFTNPFSTLKDPEEAAGNPLYLTPDEMTEFENRNKH
eukprot:Em0008g1176a